MTAIDYEVEYLEGAGAGLVRLGRSSPPGPAGEARLQLTGAVSCWFNPVHPNSDPTDLWVDLDGIDDSSLITILGLDAPTLRHAGGVDRIAVGPGRTEWVPAGWRLASLERFRSTPLGSTRPGLWALEAIVLRDALASQGLDLPDRIDVEADGAMAVLVSLTRADLEALPLVGLAVSILSARLASLDERLDRLDHLLDGAAHPGDFTTITAAFDPDRAAAGSFMAADSVAAHDQLWSQLPLDMFPDGSFASMSLVEQVTEGLRHRLRISVQRSTANSHTIFVRLVDPAGDPPRVLAVDAMLGDGTGFATVMDEPEGFDFDRTRIEIVDSLNHPLLSAAGHASARGRQWALLALAAERKQRWPEATRCWRLSEQMHVAAGDADAARAAGEQAHRESGRDTPPFFAESAGAGRVTDQGPPHSDG